MAQNLDAGLIRSLSVALVLNQLVSDFPLGATGLEGDMDFWIAMMQKSLVYSDVSSEDFPPPRFWLLNVLDSLFESSDLGIS